MTTETDENGSELTVTGISLSADQPEQTVPCLADVTFSGQISVEAVPETSPTNSSRARAGPESEPTTLSFAKSGSQDVSVTWQVVGAPGAQESGSMALAVLDPNAKRSTAAEFTLNCT